MIDDYENEAEIEKWLKAFHRVMQKCPTNLWFFSGCSDGCVHIMVMDKDGNHVYKGVGGGVDPDYMIDMDCSHWWDGGDW